MTTTMLRWHLARDNQIQLSKFCDKHQVSREIVKPRFEGDTWYMTTHFDNGGYIKAELVNGISVNENYQVVDYEFQGVIL